jgi:hypothetical protein
MPAASSAVRASTLETMERVFTVPTRSSSTAAASCRSFRWRPDPSASRGVECRPRRGTERPLASSGMYFPSLGNSAPAVGLCSGPHEVRNSAACSWPQLQWLGLLPGGWSACAAAARVGAPPVIIVTPATAISFFRPELDDFLHAPIGMEKTEMPLSVLSALARLGLDPWKEAAELSELPRDCAAQRLAVLIVRLPGGRWTQEEAGGIASRLTELLPSRSRPAEPSIGRASPRLGIAGSPAARVLICVALVCIALFAAASCEPSSGADATWSRTPEPASHPACSRVFRDWSAVDLCLTVAAGTADDLRPVAWSLS